MKKLKKIFVPFVSFVFNFLSNKRRGFFKKKFIKILIVLIIIIVSYHIVIYSSLIFFPLPDKISKGFSETYYYNDNSIAWINLNKDSQYRTYVKIKDVSRYLKKGIVYYEDKYFYFHPGFNPVSLIRSFFVNYKAKRILTGGSSITMQIARLSEPKKRTYFNKIIEIFRAMQIEARYSKNKILEIYLNLIPMGGNIEGINAASYFYFNKKPSNLTFAESVLLIGLSNSPEKNRPDKNINNAKIQRNKIAGLIYKKFNIKENELNDILNKSLPQNKNFFNYDIIPLVYRLKDLPVKTNRILSIDKNIQELSLNVLKNRMDKLNVYNGSIIVIDNSSMKVKAYVGSPYYELKGNSTKYNACAIKRSPGSTLKPFIYARAIEEGLITQKKMVFDLPEDFYGYKPKNYSNNYSGIIPADEALKRSLNIPAVYLCSQLGKDGIKKVFKDAGLLNQVYKIEDEDLSITLGSYPMTLEEMVSLYASIANKGIFNDILFFENEKIIIKNGKKILTEESCFIISEILADIYRPDLPASWEFSMDRPKVAFKTGTSYGFVDGWTVGYTPRWTVGVWVGKLDNKFTKALAGFNAACPALFDVFNELERKNDKWFTKPENVKKRSICGVSGMMSNKFCSNLIEEYYIPEFSSNEICSVHKRLILDKKTNKVVSANDIKENGEYKEIIIEVWDEKTEYYLNKLGLKNLKYKDGNYTDIIDDNKLKILSPVNNVSFVVDLNNDINLQKIPLTAAGFPDSKYFYWYANQKFLGKIETDKTLYYLPDDKKINFNVIDEKGRTSGVNVKIEFIK